MDRRQVPTICSRICSDYITANSFAHSKWSDLKVCAKIYVKNYITRANMAQTHGLQNMTFGRAGTCLFLSVCKMVTDLRSNRVAT